MHSPRRAATAAITLSLALGGGIAVAHADSSTVLYVDGSSASCTDSGTGAEAAPYCTIQAAADAAVAGDTVDIEAGFYSGPVTIASQGTAADPIVFQAVGGRVTIRPTSSPNSNRLILDGASYVSLEGIDDPFNVFDTLVENSSHITLDGLNGWFEVAGSSSYVTVSRTQLLNDGAGIKIDPGSSGDVISDNWLDGAGNAISVDDASDVAITSNTVMATGNSTTGSIAVSGASSGVTVENNIVAYPEPDTAAQIMVAAAAAAGTTVDYNVVWAQNGGTEDAAYSWASADYSTQSAFYKATGQGEHDLVADPELNASMYSTYANAPQINSANSSAPGMPSTDLYGASCSEDPAIVVTGTGSPDYCDRGAVQEAYANGVTASATPVTALTVSLESQLSQTVIAGGSRISATPEPTPAVTYTVDWGDGDTDTYPASSADAETTSPHTYAKVGTYTITDTANLLDGTTTFTTTSFTTAGSDYTPYGPSRILDTRKGIGATTAAVQTGNYIKVKVAGVGSIPANVTAVALNLTATDTSANGYLDAVADGEGLTGSNLNYLKGQTVANNAIVPVASDGYIDIYNEGDSGGTADVIGDVSGYFTQTTASAYTPVAEARLLDTRNGTGGAKAKIAAGSEVPVKIAGADSIPSGVTAVAVHVTATDAPGNGWIAAEADGSGTPTTSILNYLSGQTISNTVIVPVAADGKIELYNGGESGSVDLLADVTGYFSAGGADAYLPLTPYRAWDSRQFGGGLTPDGIGSYYLAPQVPASANLQYPADATMVTNITVTDVTGNGYVTAYPWGAARPGVSNLNYLRGQTVASLSLLATTGSYQDITVYNGSSGSGDLILDVFGYFANS